MLQALVRHLHGFARKVHLTQDEWRTRSRLTATGRITDEQRQEFVLWSDTLGLSMLVDALAHPLPAGATESTVLGPFYVPGSPLRAYGADISEQGAGTPAWITGRVVDAMTREPSPMPNSTSGRTATTASTQSRTRRAGAPPARTLQPRDGSYAFRAVRPVPYPIPDDGPVGQMLAATGRHPWRPAHIHIIVRAAGYQTLVTHVFDRESPYLDSDAVFAVKSSLVRTSRSERTGRPDTPPGVDGPWCSMVCTLPLAPACPRDESRDGRHSPAPAIPSGRSASCSRTGSSGATPAGGTGFEPSGTTTE